VIYLLKAGIADLEEVSVGGSVNAFPRQPTHVTAVTGTSGKMEELLLVVFSVGCVQRLYQESLQAV
jgi:hypothetical protein